MTSSHSILVTAGPTREPLDPVRFLSNYSTGAMGYALAAEALRRGHEVLLVLGPAEGQPPVGAEVFAVETACEMRDAVLELLPRADLVLCAAAVCDYRPANTSATKLKRGTLERIELVENPDIAAEVGARRGDTPLVVFALETTEGFVNARAKLEKKNADLCVLNSPAAIGAERAEFTLVWRDGRHRELGEVAKDELARTLFDGLGM
jgi:phosphopantothenoylcysteine decarboxylase/phosphopantothenate--cysteine ligase